MQCLVILKLSGRVGTMKGQTCVALFLLGILNVVRGEDCVQDVNCRLPDCFCPTFKHPLGAKNIPQIVYFGFDDAVTPQVAANYRELFTDDRKNPNGCPITMTLYISHDYTKYNLVSEFYERGNEMGVHSVTHQNIDTDAKLLAEAAEQKMNIEQLGKVAPKDVIGWRSPNLKTAGDDQPRILKQLNYTYDNSLSYSRDQNYPFPFTLDYGFPYPCAIQPCPRSDSKHRGFWEIMIHDFIDPATGLPCAYVDSCRPESEDEAVEYLWSNFLDTYETERSPFGLNMHAAWFAFPGYLPAMGKFIDRLLQLPDVYIVSTSQMIKWMMNPVPLSEARSFAPWGCNAGTQRTYYKRSTDQVVHNMPKLPPHFQNAHASVVKANDQSHDAQTTNERRGYPNMNLKLPPTPIPTLPAIPVRTTAAKRPVFWQLFRTKNNNNMDMAHEPSPCKQGVNCHLPRCFCKTTSPPGGLASKDIPQIVYLAIDSHIDGRTYRPLMQIFSPTRINYNGCPLTGSVFVPSSGNYPPYASALSRIGAKVGIRAGEMQEHKSVAEEINNLRKGISAYFGMYSDINDVKYTDEAFKTLQKLNTTYGNFVVKRTGPSESSWPYTMNYRTPKSYPGLWQVPLSPLRVPGDSRTCVSPNSCPGMFSTQLDTYRILKYNFNAHLFANRSPFGININEDWLVGPNAEARINGLNLFLDNVMNKPEVMVVSIDKMLQWITSSANRGHGFSC